jgi:hypothetical protein
MLGIEVKVHEFMNLVYLEHSKGHEMNEPRIFRTGQNT